MLLLVLLICMFLMAAWIGMIIQVALLTDDTATVHIMMLFLIALIIGAKVMFL